VGDLVLLPEYGGSNVKLSANPVSQLFVIYFALLLIADLRPPCVILG